MLERDLKLKLNFTKALLLPSNLNSGLKLVGQSFGNCELAISDLADLALQLQGESSPFKTDKNGKTQVVHEQLSGFLLP